MRLLYPLIASALITIVPFLVTFEKGQDIVRGLFGFSEFALLLLFVFVKNKFLGCRSWRWLVPGILIVAAMLGVAWVDLLNLLAIKGWSVGWRVLMPLVTCALALAMMWKVPPFKFNAICFILFVGFMGHLAAYNFYPAQPLAQFPVVDYLDRTAPRPVERKKLPEAFKARFKTTDSVTVTRDFLDTSRSNVVILVESWGIPMDSARFAEELSVFAGVPQQVGVHHRMYSRTRTAEREDLISLWRRDTTGHRDTTFLPQVFADLGFVTTFFYGGDSLEQRRNKYVKNIGFKNAIWGDKSDFEISRQIDSLLQLDSLRQFVAWTTRDTKFPLSGFSDPYSGAIDAVDSAYTVRLMETLNLVADLARKHPNVRFVVQGDHEPILSPIPFQERFYKRWVPYIVLN